MDHCLHGQHECLVRDYSRREKEDITGKVAPRKESKLEKSRAASVALIVLRRMTLQQGPTCIH